jgi:ribulose-bisphosphate carboxylase large chain
MLRRAEFVEKSGGTHIMVDVVTCGFSGIQTLREADFNLAIHAHRAMHAALTRSKDFGVSMKVLAKIYRLIGVDQLHIGTAHVGKMEGSAKEVLDVENSLIEEMGGLKDVFPVASGGLHPGSMPLLIERMGANIIAQFGGGVHGHPKGTKAGAAAVRQAAEGTMRGITLEEYAKTHRELAEALKKWGDKK